SAYSGPPPAEQSNAPLVRPPPFGFLATLRGGSLSQLAFPLRRCFGRCQRIVGKTTTDKPSVVFIYTLVACRFESLSLPKQTTGKLLDYTGLYRRVPLLRRIHLFEIHDQTWFPGFLRDHLTEALQLIFEVGSLYIPIVGRLQKALKDAGAQR